jgi:Ferritin-like domain
MEKIKEFVERAVSRRKFVVGAGAVAGATAALTITGCGGGSSSSPTPTPVTPTPVTPTDNDYLNYALNLEYLEAQYYLYAATGTGLIDADISAGASSSFTTVGTVTKGAPGWWRG